MDSVDNTTKITKDVPNGRMLPTAHNIAVKSLNDFPNVKHFFEIFLKDTNINIKHVGKTFSHHHLTKKFRDYELHATFMNYFIRKHLSNQLNVVLNDFRTEKILKRPENYVIGSKPDIHKAIAKHYEIYKNHKTRAMEIIKSIKIVSLARLIYFRSDQLKTEYYVNEDNLCEVMKYFQKLPYREVQLNSKLDCKYFSADADLLFDNEVIYSIRISTLESLTPSDKTINIRQFYKMIICAFAFFKKTKNVIKTLKIYNPLLGYEYSININHIDFHLFETVLKRDVDAYCSLKVLKSSNLILDLSLFPNNENTPAPGEPETNKVCDMPVKSKKVISAVEYLPVPAVYEHFASFNVSDTDDSQVQTNTNKKSKKISDTNRIRKWERFSREETALLNNNRGQKMTKRSGKKNTF